LLPEQEGAAVVTADLSTREYVSHFVVALHGELDIADAANVMAVLAAAAARNPRIIVDLAALEFIDCCALAVLGRVRVQARQNGGDLLLAAPCGQVRRILDLTGLIDVFSVHASVGEAVRTAGWPPVVTGARCQGF
jgi:anti-sigma B factor antagonist